MIELKNTEIESIERILKRIDHRPMESHHHETSHEM